MMKNVTTIALVAAFTFSSGLAFAQTGVRGTAGSGTTESSSPNPIQPEQRNRRFAVER
jgi:hypothetical protein